jgi:hypothetical protein
MTFSYYLFFKIASYARFVLREREFEFQGDHTRLTTHDLLSHQLRPSGD